MPEAASVLQPWPGDKIRALRKRLALDQVRFAALFGYSRGATVSDWERDKERPTPPVLALLDIIDGHDGWPGRPTP